MTFCESHAECISIGSYYWDFNDQYFRTLRTSLRAAFVWHNNCRTVYFLDPICVHVIRLVRSWFLGERHCTLLFLFKICLKTWNGISLVYKYTYNNDNKNKKNEKFPKWYWLSVNCATKFMTYTLQKSISRSHI